MFAVEALGTMVGVAVALNPERTIFTDKVFGFSLELFNFNCHT